MQCTFFLFYFCCVEFRANWPKICDAYQFQVGKKSYYAIYKHTYTYAKENVLSTTRIICIQFRIKYFRYFKWNWWHTQTPSQSHNALKFIQCKSTREIFGGNFRVRFCSTIRAYKFSLAWDTHEKWFDGMFFFFFLLLFRMCFDCNEFLFYSSNIYTM